MGSDGTVYAGFQDNGIGKITPSGEGVMTFVGDGGDVAIDPADSNKAFSEYVGAAVFKTTDGGKNWTDIAPEFGAAQFIAPFEMDPLDAKHIAVGGNLIVETTKGTDTVCTQDFLITGTHAGPCDWVQSYDLGTDGPYTNTAVSMAMRGNVIYAGYCGVCSQAATRAPELVRFGLATNRKPGCTPGTGSSECWHKARARGLPNRWPTDIAIDSHNPSVIYVTLGGYTSFWTPVSPKTPNTGRGHVFMSRDAGETFTDITANLPDMPAYSVAVRGSRLFIGTDLGVFTSSKPGAAWERLGRGLPLSPAFDVNLNPQGSVLLAATFGRGIWAYKLASPPARPTPHHPAN